MATPGWFHLAAPWHSLGKVAPKLAFVPTDSGYRGWAGVPLYRSQ